MRDGLKMPGDLNELMKPFTSTLTEIRAEAQKMQTEVNKMSSVVQAAVLYVAARTRHDTTPCTLCQDAATQHQCYCYEPMRLYNALEDEVRRFMEKIA